MEANIIETVLGKRKVVIMTALDVHGVLNAAWWSRVLKTLKDAAFSRNVD